jgi:hypothetical protein
VSVADATVVGVSVGMKVGISVNVSVGEGGGRNVQVGAINSVGVGVDWVLKLMPTHPSRMRVATPMNT